MTVATLPAPPQPTPALVGPTPRLWTVAEFHDMGDRGLFEGRRAMLVYGHVLEEGAMNAPHGIALEVANEAIRVAFGPGWRVRVQMPLVLGQTIDPEPDISVVPGSPRGAPTHPTTADLVVEISDSSLRYDTTEKMSLYAAAGIREYWVVNINGRQLLVHRNPAADATAPFGFAYASVQPLGPADAASPLAVPAATIRVADLLP